MSQTTHLVFVVDDDEFLEKLRDEECTFEELEGYAEEQSPNAFGISTETDLDVHRLLAFLGLRWTDEVDVEDLDGTVKLLDAEEVDDALSRLEALVAKPNASARRLATILAEELTVDVDDEAIARGLDALAEQDPRALPEEDTELDAAAQTVVQHLQALRTASENDLWIVTASYLS